VAGKRSNPKKRHKKSRPSGRTGRRRLFYWGAVLLVWGAISGLLTLGYYAITLPDVSTLGADRRKPTVTLLASNGSVLETRGNLYGEALHFEDLPPDLVKAVISTEDRRFYSHFGIDPLGLARAMVANFKAGRVVQGGSTITQQLAKNLFLTPERTLGRKIQEVMLAFWLERQFTKRELISLYLNRVYLGAGTYGVDAAARQYFGIGGGSLSLSQSAMLAGLLKAPTRYAPTRNLELSWRRTAQVLDNMVAAGHLTPAMATRAKSNPAHPTPVRTSSEQRYFTNWVLDQLPDYVGSNSSDLMVRTTLDPKLQNLAENAMTRALDSAGVRLAVGQGALVAMGHDGGVRAMVGGRSYAKSQFNRATQARRQPGSAFKLFVYLAAFERGLTPDTVMRDSPVVFGDWRPENYKREFIGEVSLRKAFANSINTVAVKVSERAGRRRVIRAAERLGITSPLPPHPSLALGTAGVSLLELTSAYAVIANGGFGVLPHGITQVTDGNGTVLYQRTGSGPGRLVQPGIVALMRQLLEATVTEGTGKAALLDRPVAGKTGTSQDFRDAWFVGYSGEVVGGVWFGNDNGQPMKNVTGGGLPARTWRRFMSGAAKESQPAPARTKPRRDFFQRLFGLGD